MQRRFIALVICLALLACCFSCKRSSTVTLNATSSFRSNGVLMEANIRELTHSGSDTSVRIRFINLSEQPVSALDALVLFMSDDGTVIDVAEVSKSLSSAIESGESVSLVAVCDRNDNITHVAVADSDS